jgi:hypothetical protein
MRVKLPLVLCHDQGEEETVTDVITLNKHQQRIEHLGLTLAESKHLVAYLRLADKYLGLLASRLRGVNQPVIRTRRGFQPLVTHRWPACERKVSAPNLSPPT